VRPVREECLDDVLIVNEPHLQRVMKDDIFYYNNAGPHQSIAQQSRIPQPIPEPEGSVHCRDLLGEIFHD
jgi:hypothetical protein